MFSCFLPVMLCSFSTLMFVFKFIPPELNGTVTPAALSRESRRLPAPFHFRICHIFLHVAFRTTRQAWNISRTPRKLKAAEEASTPAPTSPLNHPTMARAAVSQDATMWQNLDDFPGFKWGKQISKSRRAWMEEGCCNETGREPDLRSAEAPGPWGMWGELWRSVPG